MNQDNFFEYEPEQDDKTETTHPAKEQENEIAINKIDEKINNDSDSSDETGTELIIAKDLVPADVFKDGGSDKIIDDIERQVKSVVLDSSTEKGRKAIKSLNYKIARSKTTFDDMGKNLGYSLLKKKGAIDAERRKAKKRFEALQDQVTKPLDVWQDRLDAYEMHLLALEQYAKYNENPENDVSSELIFEAISDVEKDYTSIDWQEFAPRAQAMKDNVVQRLQAVAERKKKSENEQAELERLRKAEEERKQKEHDARIAKEAADKAAKEAEEKAAAEAKALADKVAAKEAEADRIAKENAEKAEAKRVRIQKEKNAAEQKAAQDAKEAADKLKAMQEKNALEKAEADRAARIAEDNRIAAEKKAAADKETAVREEQIRHEKAVAAEKAEADRREANQAHRKKINNEAMAQIKKAGSFIDADERAKAIITAIAQGKIPHVTISY